MTVQFRRKGTDEFTSVLARRGLIGWIRKDLPEDLFADFIRDPDGFLNDPSARVLKEGPKTKVIQRRLKEEKGVAREVVVKRFHYRFLLRRLGFRFFQSPAVRSLKGALLLRQRGFHTPVPLAVFEFRNWKDLGTSYYIAEEVRDSYSLRDFWRSALPTLARGDRLAVTRSTLRELAQLLGSLHSMGIYHRDLKASNILVQGWERDGRRFFLVDLDGVWERHCVSLSKRIKNLIQVRGPWSLKERIYFFMRYAELFCKSRKDCKTLVRKALVRNRTGKTPVRRG